MRRQVLKVTLILQIEQHELIIEFCMETKIFVKYYEQKFVSYKFF